MKNRKKIILGVFLVAAVMLITFIALKQQAQTQDDVAVIQPGRQITQKEKAYDRAYDSSKQRKHKKLSQVRAPGDFNAYVNAGYFDSINPNPNRGQIVGNRVCNADAIIIGRAGNKSTHLNEDETLVYSEYDVIVQEIIKNNANSPIQVNSVIQVTRPGGNIRYNGRLIRFIDGKHSPLLGGNYYLLFLKYVPEASGYIPLDESDDYFLNGNKATPTILSSTRGKEVEPEDAGSLLNFVRTIAASSNCKQN
ncbi:MAG: hypothetical protein ACR2N3_18340 [Pyrinomonadaceae bacterium]